MHKIRGPPAPRHIRNRDSRAPSFLAREYNSDLRVDHWTAVKIILSKVRICFSIMEVTKRFVVKGYVDANFDTDPDDSKSQSGYILKVGAIS